MEGRIERNKLDPLLPILPPTVCPTLLATLVPAPAFLVSVPHHLLPPGVCPLIATHPLLTPFPSSHSPPPQHLPTLPPMWQLWLHSILRHIAAGATTLDPALVPVRQQ